MDIGFFLKILCIYIVNFICGHFVYACKQNIDNYGLMFAAHDKDQDHRTSLSINLGEVISFPQDGFIVKFKLKLRKELYNFGYVVRFISHDVQNVDLIAYLNENKLMLVAGNESSNETSYLSDFNIIKEDKWLNVSLQFERNFVELIVDDKHLKVSHFFQDFNKLRIVFGANKIGRFFSNDVPPMSIKDIIIQTWDGNNLFYWPLDRGSENCILYDSISKMPSCVKHGQWEISKHYHWSEVTSFNINYLNPQLAYNQENNSLYIVTDKNLFIYNLIQNSLDTIRFNAGYPFLGVSSYLYYHPIKKQLFSYCSTYPQINWFDMQTASWTVKDKIYVGENQHHNRYFDLYQNKLFVYGGYGFHCYNSNLLSYDFNNNQGWNVSNLDTLMPPRYLAALGKYSEKEVLILGGYGSYSGKQENSPQCFYDLFKIKLQDNSCERIWRQNADTTNCVMGNSAIVDTCTNSIYALTYRNDCYNTTISLSRFPIYGEYMQKQIVSDSILFHFRDIYSYCDLFFNPIDSFLYSVILQPQDKDNSLCKIYKLKYPPLCYSNIHLKSSTKKEQYYLYIIAIICLCIVLLIKLYKKNKTGLLMYKQMCEKKHEVALFNTLEDLEASFKNKNTPLTKLKSTIRLLGGFQVYDVDGNNVTGEFSPTLKLLFIFLLLNAVKDTKGVTSQQLDEIFWFEMSKSNALNNRSVNMRKLRILLSKIGEISIVHKNGYWHLEIGDNLVCDYLLACSILKEISDDKNINVQKIEDLLQLCINGVLLPDVNVEWLDEYKSHYHINLTEKLLELSLKPVVNNDFRLLLNIAEVILAIDSIDEDAMQLKCSILYKIGRKGMSKQCYDHFCADYKRILNTNPNITYRNSINYFDKNKYGI